MSGETMERVTPLREERVLSPYAPWETALEAAMARMLMTACRDLNPRSRISASIINEYLTDCLRWLIAFNAARPVLTALDWPEAEGEKAALREAIPDDFERWLVEKWRRDVASPEFRETAQFEELMAEWERGG